jgi:hypothetical protein
MNLIRRSPALSTMLTVFVCMLGLPSAAQAQGATTFDTANAPSEQTTPVASSPQLVGVSSGDVLTMASQRHSGGKPHSAWVTQFQRSAAGIAQTWEKKLPLPRLVGLASDGSNLYAVSAVNEDLAPDASIKSFRANVLVMTKFDAAGNTVWQRDLNNAAYLGDAAGNGEAKTGIFSPLTGGTGAVSYGNGKVLVAIATNTLPDRNLSGSNLRHQRAQYFVVGADGSGFKAASETSWRHSFDQRLLHDGQDFVFMDLADAGWFMPGAGITLRKIKPTAAGADFIGQLEGVYIYARQGETAGAQNFSFISLGQLQTSRNGYGVLFASEKTNRSTQRDGWKEPVLEPRNLAYVHVKRGFETVQEGLRDGKASLGNLVAIQGQPIEIKIGSSVVDSQGATTSFTRSDKAGKTATSTGVVWLTNLAPGVSAERPKFVKVSEDRFVALWEEWTYNGQKLSHRSTQAMLLNAAGQVLTQSTGISARLNPSGADVPFSWNGSATWITGGANAGGLVLNSVDANLRLTQTSLGQGANQPGALMGSGPTQTTAAPSPAWPAVTPPTTPAATVATAAAAATDTGALPLRAGTRLVTGRRYRSESGGHYLVLQPDGNMVVYNAADRYIWGLDKVSSARQIRTVELQTDGNLVARRADGGFVWSALTRDTDTSATLSISPAGALQLVSGRTGATLWASDGRISAVPAATGGTSASASPLVLEVGKQYALREGDVFRYVKVVSLVNQRPMLGFCPDPSVTYLQMDMKVVMRVEDALAQGLFPASSLVCDLAQVPYGR